MGFQEPFLELAGAGSRVITESAAVAITSFATMLCFLSLKHRMGEALSLVGTTVAPRLAWHVWEPGWRCRSPLQPNPLPTSNANTAEPGARVCYARPAQGQGGC